MAAKMLPEVEGEEFRKARRSAAVMLSDMQPIWRLVERGS